MTAVAYEYSDEVKGMREGLASFVRQEVIGRHEKYAHILENDRKCFAEDGRYSPEAAAIIREVRMASAKAGYYAMCAPAEFGGLEMGNVAHFAAWERIARMCGGKYWLGYFAIGHWAMGPSPVLRKVTQLARDEMLPGIMSGEKSMCFGLSEPGAGSDATMIKTRATPDGDGWRLNGGKIWTTNSPLADYVIVFAVTDPERAKMRKGGISAFLIPVTASGFSLQQIVRIWGSIGGNEAVLHFDDIRIEPHQLVGELHNGFSIAMLGVNLGRIYNSARSIGMARWALEQALDYVKIRETFGKPIAEYQGVSFPLAEAAMQLHAAHLMSLNVAQLLDRGLPARKELSMTKCFSVQAAAKAIDTVIQVHGAIGVTNEMYFTEAYFGARTANIADGSNEILKRTIVKQMLEGDTEI
ncbi:MAG TPA: acyl-CoA dehydrogenase family protein [Rhizomicrobium sp.]